VNREQRYKHEMLVRVRDYGAAHAELFPESSAGAEKFARVTAAVAAIEEHLKNRVLGKAGARRVNTTTRAAVFDYMRTLAKAARRITRQRRNETPFLLPRRRTLKVEVATARAFLEEAEQRQAQFVGMGLPATFINDFRSLVNELEQAVDTRLSSKTLRGHARAGIAGALREGLEIVRDLDVVVDVATRQNEVLAATWRVARRIEGQASPSASAKSPEADAVVAPPVPAAVDPPAADAASPPAVEVPSPTTAAPAEDIADRLGRAS
jgi:hypothetical protein